ncbi:MAG: dTDP-glucose 4,6-dehydratase [Thermomicrobiales bacterium]|nr:MAG: dTDP-glucose 4,6-dehydratase [Thermomicrobiales bacterium]
MREIEYEGGKTKIYSTAGRGETLLSVMARRYSRRSLLKGGAAASAVVLTGPVLGRPVRAQGATPAAGQDTLSFEPIPSDAGPDIKVAPGYRAEVFVSWGDGLTADTPAFDLAALTPELQAKMIGYNNDFLGFLPLPLGSSSSDHGLLVINHEYTNPELMFPGYLTKNPAYTEGAEDIPEFLPNPTQQIVDIELQAHGVSIIEVQRNEHGTWEVVKDSPYNRRITAITPIVLSGPAAGHPWLITSEDATGTHIAGTLNNCAGGLTPWGTFVTCEENFHQYFAHLGKLDASDPVVPIHERYGLPEAESERRWEQFYGRFDLTKEPHEPFRFGWAVEIDPYDPQSTPKKRTALGRFKHEGVSVTVTPSGQVALYMGDDERFDYVYKFVSAGAYDPNDRSANMDLLDDGVLYAAKFNDDGTGEWLPLVFGQGPLTEANGFTSQADVLLKTRLAADALGATKMDRPEDIEISPVNGRVYIALTNNTRRGAEGYPGVDAANPREKNAWGHIIELREDGGDHASETFTWEIFILCGDPEDESTYFAGFPKEKVSAVANPDNLAFDPHGNLWISTDGQPNSLKVNDGVFAVPVDGSNRGYLRQFFSAVPGAESASLCFTPDGTTLFVSVQHPGEGGTFDQPLSTWPGTASPARPSVVVIQKEDGGPIGS